MIEPDKVSLDRTVFNIKPGNLAQFQDSIVRIKDFINHEEILISYVDTSKIARVYTHELTALQDESRSNNANLNIDHSEVKDEQWRIALFRFNVIQPFIDASTETQVKEAANRISIHYTTVYKWLTTY